MVVNQTWVGNCAHCGGKFGHAVIQMGNAMGNVLCCCLACAEEYDPEMKHLLEKAARIRFRNDLRDACSDTRSTQSRSAR